MDGDGCLLESECDDSGQEIVLAQIIRNDNKFKLTARDACLLRSLFNALESLLSSEIVPIVRKLAPKKFEVAICRWVDDKYIIESQDERATPPQLCVWLESGDKDSAFFSSRIYQRTKGQIVLKVKPGESFLDFLCDIRNRLDGIAQSCSLVVEQIIEKPVIQVEAEFNIFEAERALAKIGTNLLAYIMGGTYLRHPAFDEIKKAILTGEPRLPHSFMGDDDKEVIDNIFGESPDHFHVLMLSGIPNIDGTCNIVFLVKLYGASAHRIVIAEKAPYNLALTPSYFLVDYESNNIARIPMLDYQLTYCEHAKQLERDAKHFHY
ncbi:hypothetical protein [Pseudomonas taiwanensis]|uniref:hypothetical protein n=1 Tax=Pseudomonas taiwanensis TaxID=470150 RepID=UPI001644BD2A|nr:hypothetical protein [Pseudomonas taiwanensis]MBC3490036.1 hypothetical protein [Pseudomonas taiwanensis]